MAQISPYPLHEELKDTMEVYNIVDYNTQNYAKQSSNAVYNSKSAAQLNK